MPEKNEPLDLEEIKKEIKEEVLQWLYKEVKQPDKYLISIALGHAIRKTVERIRKACEFYLRYKDKPRLLWKEFEFSDVDDEKKCGEFVDRQEEEVFVIDEYNEWLFKLAFRGVFENARKE